MKKSKQNNKIIYLYVFILIILIIIILWLYLYRDPCKERNCIKSFNDDGFGYIDNFLSNDDFLYMKNKYVKKNFPMYNTNTTILGNGQKNNFTKEDLEIVNNIKAKIEIVVGKPLYIDYAFLRYYNGKAPNPFEFFHYDSKHFDYNTTQIRSVINLYDKSIEGEFCYKSKCCEKGKIYCNHTTPNTLTLIQANKLVHKYEYKGGERLIFVIDFTTSYNRGLYGSVWGGWDYVWDRMQKFMTSFNNK